MDHTSAHGITSNQLSITPVVLLFVISITFNDFGLVIWYNEVHVKDLISSRWKHQHRLGYDRIIFTCSTHHTFCVIGNLPVWEEST